MKEKEKEKKKNQIEIQEMYDKGLNTIRHTPLLKKKKKNKKAHYQLKELL